MQTIALLYLYLDNLYPSFALSVLECDFISFVQATNPESLVCHMLTTIDIKDGTQVSRLNISDVETVHENSGRTIYFAEMDDKHGVRCQVAIKKIDLQLSGQYSNSYSSYTTSSSDSSASTAAPNLSSDSSASTASPSLSTGDIEKIDIFIECCQEAVLQHDVFDHPNVLSIKNRWIQTDISWGML